MTVAPRFNGHTCHVPDCEEHVAPALLMCRPHWRMVPSVLQQAVWSAYVPGQERRKDATTEYVEVARKAVEAVLEKKAKKRSQFETVGIAVLHHHLADEVATDGDFVQVVCGCGERSKPCPEVAIALDAHVAHVLSAVIEGLV